METFETTISLADVMRHNVRRLREVRGLTVRGLGDRLESMGSPITGSAVSKIESGSRSISVADWSALAAALTAPMTAFLLLPDPRDPLYWSPKQDAEARSWARPEIENVALGTSITISRSLVAQWFKGATHNLAASILANHSWYEGDRGIDGFREQLPAAERVREQMLRHPVLVGAMIVDSTARTIFDLEQAPEMAYAARSEAERREDRRELARTLQREASRLKQHVDLMVSEIEEREGDRP